MAHPVTGLLRVFCLPLAPPAMKGSRQLSAFVRALNHDVPLGHQKSQGQLPRSGIVFQFCLDISISGHAVMH